MLRRAFVLTCLFVVASARAQNPLRHFSEAVDLRFARSQPVVHYTLSISEGDTTGWDVRIDVRNARDTFRVALAQHPEYDDRFFRYVQNLRVTPGGSIVREDTALWRVIAPGGTATISYRIQLPTPTQPPRGAWRPFLSSTGGLTGGPHAFMYIVGAELAPSHVFVAAPSSWSIATGLTPTSEPGTFFAASVYELVESPILVGQLRRSHFFIDGVPHNTAFWPSPNATPFDTSAFRSSVERLVNEVVKFFGRPVYREYNFLFQDNSFGALEHHNSVTLGVPSVEMARDPNYVLGEIAHEYFHTWNLMRIRPVEYAAGVDYRAIKPVPSLWFSEGFTMMYADLLLRRAKLPTHDSTRVSHLEGLITRYFASPGNTRYSPEQVSRVAYHARPDALGDYDASTHLQGELLGVTLDLIIRDATNGRRSTDDVMRLMLDRFGGERGFTGRDVEAVVHQVCACDVHAFFEAHVRGAQPIPFDKFLALIGMRTVVTREPVVRDGQAVPDFRIRAWNAPPDSALSLLIGDPRSVWGQAGLHSRDRVVSVNGESPRTSQEFRQIIGRTHIGDTLRFVVQAPAAAARNVSVVVTGYDRPLVRIEPLAAATAKQRRLRDAWLNGTP
jgi:predicted metalloprotease with PDZ domain